MTKADEELMTFGIVQKEYEVVGNVLLDKDDPRQPHFVEFHNKEMAYINYTEKDGNVMTAVNPGCKWIRFDIKHKTVGMFGIAIEEMDAVKHKAIELWGE